MSGRRTGLRSLVVSAGALTLATAYGVGPGASPASAVTCQAVPGSGGLTAVVLVSSPTTVTGTFDASSCDIGVYVGPGGDGTVIDGATVTGAHAEGVLLQRVDHVVLRHSTISGSASAAGAFGQHPPKAVMLVGTTDALVQDNAIVGNAGGGLAVSDDGPVHPATLAAGVPAPAVGNVIRENRFHDDAGGCAVVLGAYNAGQGVVGNTVMDNVMTGTPGVFGPHGPDIASIVVAANLPNTLVQDNRVLRNQVSETFIPGIIVHANAPGAVAQGTSVVNNVVRATDWGRTDGPDTTVGISLATQSSGATIRDTEVAGNRISEVDVGIWLSGDVEGTDLGGYGVNHATHQVVWAS